MTQSGQRWLKLWCWALERPKVVVNVSSTHLSCNTFPGSLQIHHRYVSLSTGDSAHQLGADFIEMGRKAKGDSVDLYFDKISSATPSGKLVGSYKCKCCLLVEFKASSRTRLVAHLVGISGQGVASCTQCVIQIPPSELRALAMSTESGKRHLLTCVDDPRLAPCGSAPSAVTGSSSGPKDTSFALQS